MAESSSEYTRMCSNRRNKRIRVENDYNRVLKEYILVKYGAIAEEFTKFYDTLRAKYPENEKAVYKGAKKFRFWVRSEIESYDAENPNVPEAVSTEAVINVPDPDTLEVASKAVSKAVVNVPDPDTQEVASEAVSEAVVNVPDPDTLEVVNLAEIIDNTVGANVVVPPLENVIANGLPQELEELNGLIGNILEEIESHCDEGICLTPHHELEVDPLYYEEEIEGLDDIDIDLPVNLLEAELEIELERF